MFSKEKENKTNRWVINSFWVSIYILYLCLFFGRIYGINNYGINSIYYGMILSFAFGVSLEVFYKVFKSKKYNFVIKYYIIIVISISSFYLVCLTQKSALYFYSIVGALFYYDNLLIISAVIIDIILVLIRTIMMDFTTEAVVFTYVNVFLFIFFLVAYGIKTRALIMKKDKVSINNKKPDGL
ncbi:MAG: hypothetical protein ACM3UU_03445 [Ignavibacteriales bacterium]